MARPAGAGAGGARYQRAYTRAPPARAARAVNPRASRARPARAARPSDHTRHQPPTPHQQRSCINVGAAHISASAQRDAQLYSEANKRSEAQPSV